MSPDVDYRTGGATDVAAVSALAQAAYGGEADTWRQRMHRAVSQLDAHLVLAHVAGQLVGYGKAAPCQPRGDQDRAPAGTYLTGLVVSPPWRRSGIGQELTRRRVSRVWQRGQPAWCFTNARNQASLVLHQRLGFVEVGRATSYLGESFEGGLGVLLRADPPSRSQGKEVQQVWVSAGSGNTCC